MEKDSSDDLKLLRNYRGVTVKEDPSCFLHGRAIHCKSSREVEASSLHGAGFSLLSLPAAAQVSAAAGRPHAKKKKSRLFKMR